MKQFLLPIVCLLMFTIGCGESREDKYVRLKKEYRELQNGKLEAAKSIAEENGYNPDWVGYKGDVVYPILERVPESQTGVWIKMTNEWYELTEDRFDEFDDKMRDITNRLDAMEKFQPDSNNHNSSTLPEMVEFFYGVTDSLPQQNNPEQKWGS